MSGRQTLTLAHIQSARESFPPEVRINTARFKIHEAFGIARHFLGSEWVERHVAPSAELGAADFFRVHAESGLATEIKVFRLFDLVETLFNLQAVPGFDDFLNRLRVSELEAGFAEIDCARFLYVHGVKFEFVRPVGRKGSDYDFKIIYPDGRNACADAKCRLEGSEVRAEPVASTLNDARSQFPMNEPSVIMLKISQQMVANAAVRRDLIRVVERFLRGTQRVVSVVIYAPLLFHVVEQAQLVTDFRYEEVVSLRHRFSLAVDWRVIPQVDIPQEWQGMPPWWTRIFTTGDVVRRPPS